MFVVIKHVEECDEIVKMSVSNDGKFRGECEFFSTRRNLSNNRVTVKKNYMITRRRGKAPNRMKENARKIDATDASVVVIALFPQVGKRRQRKYRSKTRDRTFITFVTTQSRDRNCYINI